MKNQFLFGVAMLCLVACRKVDDLAAPPGTQDASSAFNTHGIQPGAVENLGHVFSGNNVTWKINPTDANNTPLFTFLPHQNSGYCMLMIDNGKMDGLTPLGPFRFVVVDMQTKTSKIVTVKTQSGTDADYSFGRITRYVFGLDHKYYVATEGSPAGGGHLIQYDPDTQTALDLGRPFFSNGKYLDIYSLNVGTDGALYGGSFGGSGDVLTFRYGGDGFYVDAAPLDNTSRYVTAVSGDSRYTYAVCGKNNWTLYAIDRETGVKQMVRCNQGSTIPIDMDTRSDASYAHCQATFYKMDGFTCMPMPEYETPQANRLWYTPYTLGDPTVPQVAWSKDEKKVYYQLANGDAGSIAVSGLIEDVYPTTGPMLATDNKLYMACYKQGLLGSYNPSTGFETIGCTSMVLQAMAAPPGAGGKLYLGGYPKGGLIEYTPTQNWSVNVTSFVSVNGGYATSTTNPKYAAYFQDADGAGVNGAINLQAMAYTKNGYLVCAGNADRITTSSGRELSMGSYRNGSVHNFRLPEFADYSFQSFCLSADSNSAYVAGISHSGANLRLYKYDPASNSSAKSWDIPLWGDGYAVISLLKDDVIAGICEDCLFLYDLNSSSFIWKQALGGGQKIFSFAVAPDHSVLINYMHAGQFQFKVDKYDFDISNKANVKYQTTPIADWQDSEEDPTRRPSGMFIAPSFTKPGYSDVYLSGLNSLYRIKG